MLGDTSGLAGNHVGLPYVVEEGSLTVVDVSHHSDDRRPGDEVFLPVFLLLLDFLGELRGHELDLVAELLRHEHQGLGVEPLVDGHHEAEAEAGSDDLVHRGVVHKCGKVVHGHELSHLEHLLLGGLLLEFLLELEGCELSLLLPVLGSEVALLAVVHLCICLLDLLLNLLLHLLLFGLGHCRLEAVAVASLAVLGIVLALVLSVLAVPVIPALALLLSAFVVPAVVLSSLPGVVLVNLVHIDLLAAVLGYALALLSSLRLELGEVHLADYLESAGADRLDWLHYGHRLLHDCRGCRLVRRGLSGLAFLCLLPV